MPDIFISYRRDDTRADAGRLYDRLAARFGDDHVFMDIEDIEAGEDFIRVLERTLESCDVLIVLIGPEWLDPAGEGGGPRLTDPEDWVRLEVEKALEREIRTIPVLVGGAPMPAAGRLPPELAGLASRQALEVSDTRFHEDVDHLINVLNGLQLGGHGPDGSTIRKWGYLAAAVTLCVVAGAVFVNRVRVETPALRSQGSVLSGAAAKAMVTKHDFYHRSWNSAAPGIENDYAAEVVGQTVVVRDAATGLVWQKGGSGGQMDYTKAQRLVAQLNAEGHAGFSDWRIPTLEEAMTLVEPEADSDGWYIGPVFERSAAPILWTSDRSESGKHWVVYLGEGLCSAESTGYNAWVRAVRAGD